MSGQSNHICKVELENTQDKQLLNSILECLFLTLKEDKENFKLKFASGFLKSVVIDDEKLFVICGEAIHSNGVNTETLKTIFKLLAKDELNLKEIKEALVKNFLIGFVDIGGFNFDENHESEIKRMFSGGNKNQHRKLLKEWSDKEEERINKIVSLGMFANSLSLGQKGIRIERELNDANTFKLFIQLYYNCLDSLICNNNDSGIDRIIEEFNNSSATNNDVDERIFDSMKGNIIERFYLLRDDDAENSLVKSLIKKIQEKVRHAEY